MRLERSMIRNATNLCKKYQPVILSVAGIMPMIYTIYTKRDKARIYMALYNSTKNEYYWVRYLQLTHSNNWLRMHGYPMKKRHFKD